MIATREYPDYSPVRSKKVAFEGRSAPPRESPQATIRAAAGLTDRLTAEVSPPPPLANTRAAGLGFSLNKAIPQVQAMKEKEDLTEYFQLFENTQKARNNPKEALAYTLMPLLNICKSLALSLPATTQLDDNLLKTELLALAVSQTEHTPKMFWERKKPVGNTWREEVAILTKLLRRCRERKPNSPSEAADLISTYFRAHSLIETEWELKEKEQKDFRRSATSLAITHTAIQLTQLQSIIHNLLINRLVIFLHSSLGHRTH